MAINPPNFSLYEFLKEKFAACVGYPIMWIKEEKKRSKAYSVTELELAAQEIEAAGADADVYVAISTQAEAPDEKERGPEETVRSVPGLFADIDLADAKGAETGYSKNQEEALAILDTFPLKPTWVINTGNGVHAHFDFPEPLQVETEQERTDAKALSVGFQRALVGHFRTYGRKIDSVADLVRLCRPPGTFNHKSKPPKPVTILRHEPGNRVTRAQVQALIDASQTNKSKKSKAPPQQLADHALIVDGCEWYRECVVNGAKTCSEPDWFAGASITALCKDAERTFMDYSRHHPEFKEREAREKFKRAVEHNAPRTCESIAEDLGHKGVCEACTHYGVIATPLQLGRLGSNVALSPLTFGCVMTAEGLFFTSKKNDAVVSDFISGPFEIKGLVRDPKGAGWGRLLVWRDLDGRKHEHIALDRDLLNDHDLVTGDMVARGLRIGKGKQSKLADYILSQSPSARVTQVAQTGWHKIAGKSVFVLPGETIGEAAEPVIYEGVDQDQVESAAAGTLEEWRQRVSGPAGEHALGALAISAALAAPLLRLSGQESGGIHFFGNSSTGKTTLLRCAASVWGDAGFVHSWRATANGLEGIASRITDMALILDELGQIDSKEAGSAVYMLATGVGKIRMNCNATLKDSKTWRASILSSGEMTIESKIQQVRGATAFTGATLRLLNVAADRERGFGAFDHAGPSGDAGDMVKEIAAAAASHYGVAGPAFVRGLLAHGDVVERVRDAVASFIKENVEADSDGQLGRAAKHFGLIAAAGELATEFGVTGWERGQATAAAAQCLERWKKTRGGDGKEPAEDRRAILHISRFIVQYGDSRFDELNEYGYPVPPSVDAEGRPSGARSAQTRHGWRKGSGADRIWMIDDSMWEELCRGFDPIQVSKALARHGMLKTAKGRYTYAETFEGKRNKRFHVITGKILSVDYDATEEDVPDDEVEAPPF